MSNVRIVSGTNEFIVFDEAYERFYKAISYDYSIVGFDKVIISVTKLK